jgi:hypothetical protein
MVLHILYLYIILLRVFTKKAIYNCVILSAVLAGCSGRIDGSLERDGSVELSLDIRLEPRMTALIRSLSAFAGNSPAAVGAPVLKGPAIARSMAAAPGIGSVSLRNSSPSSVTGEVRISRIGDFLALPAAAGMAEGGGKRFITYVPADPQGGAPGNSRLLIALDRDTAPLVLAMISEDVRDYLSALLAPAATGELLSREEYLELVEVIYGKALADEIASARVTASIGFPGPVVSVKGGTFTGTQAHFDIPLADLLVLENPLEYEVIWK